MSVGVEMLLKCYASSLPEQNRRGLRRDQASRRMVALYDYDPRESSPNVDVEVTSKKYKNTTAKIDKNKLTYNPCSKGK